MSLAGKGLIEYRLNFISVPVDFFPFSMYDG